MLSSGICYYNLMSRSVYWAFLIFLFAIAIFFRFYKLGSIPVSLYWDEAAILVDARSIAETGKDMHGGNWFQAIYPSYGDFKLPILIWLSSVSVAVFGASNFAVRFVSAVAGIGTIFIGILLVRELLKLIYPKEIRTADLFYKATLAVVLVIGTSFWSIYFSRTAFEGHIGQALVGLSVYFTFVGRKKWQWYLVAVLVGALAVYTYYSVRFVWPVVFLGAAVLPFLAEQNSLVDAVEKINNNWKKVLLRSSIVVVSIALFFVLLVPMWNSPYYAASQQFRLSAASILQRDPQVLEANKLRELAGNTPIDRLFFHRDLLTLKLLAEHYSKHLSFEYLFISGDTNLRHGTHAHGLFALVLVIPLLIGLYALARNKLAVLLFLIGWWLISLLPASVPFDVPHALRSLNALLPLSIIIGFGVLEFLNIQTLWKKLVSLGFFLFFAMQLTQFWVYYTTFYPVDSAQAWQGGYKALAQKVMNENDSYDSVWVGFADKRVYLWFLAYPDYTVEQVQQFEKKNFEIDKIENINFKPYDYHDITTMKGSILLVKEASALESELQEQGITPTVVEYINDEAGTTRYMLAGFRNSK